MYIIKESMITYDNFTEAIQQYVDDNYNDSTIKTIVLYLKSGHEKDFSSRKYNHMYRGIFYPNVKNISSLHKISDKNISATYSLDEARAFAFGSNIYEFSNINSELKSMSKNDCAIVYHCDFISQSDIMIDVPYCLKNNLLPEVSFIEENEVMLYPVKHSLRAVEVYHGGIKVL